MDCGFTYPPYVMDFDHIDGEKAFNIGMAVCRRGSAALLAEAAKCEIVCSNCHRARTWHRQSHPTLKP